jgi:uncharacterized membrane protein
MNTPPERSVDDRLAELEERFVKLEYTVERLAFTIERRHGAPDSRAVRRERRAGAAMAPPTGGAASEAAPAVAPVKSGPTPARPKPLFDTSSLAERGSEFWLGRIGIGLVLFGVVFLFKYAVDQGWLVPGLRVILGLALGLTLYALSIRLRSARQTFRGLMAGGSIATFYITGFAATELYELFPYAVGFAFMAGVTVLALATALWQEEPIFANVGALGGLGTPFLLEADAPSALGFATYISAVLIGATAIHFVRGWRAVLWIAAIGGWSALAFGLSFAGSNPATADRWAFQIAGLVVWLSLWLGPVVRELRQPLPGTTPEPVAPHPWSKIQHGREAHVLALLTPLIALWYSSAIWSVGDTTWGWIALAGAATSAVAGWAIRDTGRYHLAFSHFAAAIVLVTIALGLLLEDEWLLVAWATEATMLHVLGQRTRSVATTAGGQFIYIIVVLWLASRLVDIDVARPFFTTTALTDLVVIGMMLAATKTLKAPDARWTYLFLVHAALLGFLWRELSGVPNGNGYVTISWGVYAIGLVVYGLVRGVNPVRGAGVATLMLVVGKLFLVDLARVEAIVRILLFLGFGAVFLALSYFFRSLLQRGTGVDGGDGDSYSRGRRP